MTGQQDAAKWEQIADDHAAKVSATIKYYLKEIEGCAKCDRRLSVVVMLLGILTPVLVAQVAVWDGIVGLVLKVGSIVTATALAVTEGLRKIYAYDKRWAASYTALLALRRARADYKIKRLGLPPGSEDWKKNFITYQNLYHDTIAKETQDFFTHLGKAEKGTEAGKL
ncbi:SLATT domain-containing protein [Rhizobium sp. YS-1r]|uniref:SLATT domain-containing protein n=1 Tax=Rhizobium sp. YS-1r TaxID=1532558 RepID=UPI00050F43B2|nr:SLATT domain-containing protein [Rhizobium sp. YS-1r]KGD94434.1 hypothetical protein JL39_21465 [Rhizobium sp. YS-1r]